MSPKNRHDCDLSEKDASGLPKLAPNASWLKKCRRNLRRIVLVNSKNYKSTKYFRNKTAIIAERRRHGTGPYFYVIHPMSLLCSMLQFVFVTTWIFNLLLLPAYDFLPEDKRNRALKIHDQITGPIQVILIILFFNIGYINKKKRIVELNPKKIICKYLTTYFFFDVMSMPYLHYLFHKLKIGKTYLFFVIVLTVSTSRIFSTAFRIPVLINTLHNLLATMKLNKSARSAICYIIKTFILIHLFGYLIHKVPTLAYNRDVPKQSWLHQSGLTYPHESYESYSESLILASCYFFGIEPKYTIKLLPEEVVVVFISIFGRLYTLYLLADVLRLFGIAGVSQSTYERQMMLMRQYMDEQGMPHNLRQRSNEYFEYKFQGRYFQEDKIIQILSDNLRTELFLFSARKMIEKVDIFQKLPHSAVGDIITAMRSETYSPNDIIIPIGMHLEDIYFISTGTLAIVSHRGMELGHYEDGDAFGMSTLILNEQRYAVVAVETTEVFYITKQRFLEVLDPYPEVKHLFYRSAKDRINYLIKIENQAHEEKNSLLTDLQRGIILEKRLKKFSFNE